MKLPFVAAISAACLLVGCASPSAKEMRTGRDALKRAWHDAKDGNWEVCAMNLATTRQHLQEGVKLQPVKTTKTGSVDLQPYLIAVESGPWPKLLAAVRQRELESFKSAYVETATACAACHTAAGRPKLCLHLPEEAFVSP